MSATRLGPNAFFAALVLAGLVAWFAWLVAADVAERRQAARLDQALLLTDRAVESEIERFSYLPRVVGEDARIRAAVASPDPASVDAANRYLETVANQSGAAQLFLMNAHATAVATSNWRAPDDLTGNTYDFRPYYHDALEQGEGRYYAIGATTGTPGYFIASRVDVVGGFTGIVVAKVDMRSLETTWRQAGVQTALMDRDGVIFLTGEPSWAYRPLKPMTEQALDRIATERTYVGVDVAAAEPLVTASDPVIGDPVLSFPDAGGALLARLRILNTQGWTLLTAAPRRDVLINATFWSLGAALFAMVGTSIAMILNQRRQLVGLQLRQGALLEARVQERTRELGREIEARRKTEADLHAAQETLIHTEKMAALGRMSAAIVHELSQPLAAMEATLTAAELSTDSDKITARIGIARNLIRRMQRTTKHLKTFSRKDQNTRSLTDLNKVASNALDLVAPRAKAVGIAPDFLPCHMPPEVMAGPVRLEQVCVNLLLNALDAVEGLEGGAITLTTDVNDGIAYLRIVDNGSGIEPGNIERVKEPFFSTKISGEGLGLGLSISQAIVTEFGGRIDIASEVGAGTQVTISLQATESGRAAAE